MNGDKDPAAPPTGWHFKADDNDPAPKNHEAVAGSSATAPPEALEMPAPAARPEAPADSPSTPAPASDAVPAPGRQPHAAELEWQASDAALHQKPAGWLAMLIGGGLVVAILVYLLTRDALSAGAIALAALMLGVYSARKPQSLRYRLDAGGITIGQKHYTYGQFRSFSVVDEGAAGNVELMPLKRFMPMLTLNYTHDIEEDVVSFLADRLPMETHKRDAMDMLIRKLRF